MQTGATDTLSPGTKGAEPPDRRTSVRWEALFGYDVFISYHREPDTKLYAKRMAFELISRDLTCFLDQRETVAGYALDEQLEGALGKTRVLFVILTPGALASDYVRQEVAYFRSHHRRKRLIVLVVDRCLEGLDKNDVHWGFLRELQIVWLDITREELGAETPRPETLRAIEEHFGYGRANRLRRAITGGVIVGLLGLASLAWYKAIQSSRNADEARKQASIALRNEAQAKANAKLAQEQSRIARSRQLAAEAFEVLDAKPDLARLLAVEAWTQADSFDARNALFSMVESAPGLKALLRLPKDVSRYTLALGARNSLLAIGSEREPYGYMAFPGVELWDARRLTRVGRLQALSAPDWPITDFWTHDLCFNREGRWLASIVHWGDDDLNGEFAVQVWPIRGSIAGPPRLLGEATLAFTPDGRPGPIAFSEDGRSLFVVRSAGLDVWQTADWSAKRYKSEQIGAPDVVRAESDGAGIVVGSRKGGMRRLQINGQRLELARESNKPVLDVSADGKLYAELTEPTLLQIVESASGKVVGSSRLVGGDGEFELAKFSPDGTLLLVRKAQAATTLVYGPSNLDPPNSMYPQGWTTLAELPFQMVANSTVIATDNSFLFGIDDRVRRIEDGAVEGALLGKWEVQPKPRRIEGGWDPPFWFETHDVVHAYGRAELNKGGAWRLDFASLKAALEDGTIEEAVASGRVVGVLRRGTRRTGSRAPTLELIDIGTGASRALVALEGREGSGLVGVTPDGALAILEHGEVVDSATGKLLRKLEIPADMFISHTACAPDGWAVLEVWQPVKERSKLLAGELRTGKLKSLDLPYGALSMSMDASGLRVAVPVGKNVLVFDARTLRAVGEPLGHSVDIVDIAFSQDGAELAAGDEWRGIWLWDMREQQRYRTALRGSEGELLFSPDRRMLFSAGNEGAVLWDLDPEGYRQRALEQANRPLTRAERDHYMGWERGPAGGEAGNRMDGGEGLRRASGSH